MSAHEGGAACGRNGFVVPARRDRWPNFGLLALVLAAGGLLSGLFLAFHYAPTLDAARDSVDYIQHQVVGGSWLRGIHHWAANFAIVLAAIHGLRLFWHGAYKKPRRALWMIGCGIFLTIVGFAYTGYLLPGDERAYAGIGIMKAVAGSTPLAGDVASKIAIGGDSISSATLTRLYAIHTMVLPIALAALLGAFFYFWRCVGPARHHADDTNETTSAWTFAVQRDATAGLVVLALVVFCAWVFPAALGPKADPGGAGAPDAQPEWFMLWANELLHMESLSKIPNATFVLAGLIPGLLVALGIGLPLLFRKPERDPRKRKPELVLGAVVLLTLIVLGGRAAARAPATDESDEPDDEEPTTVTTTDDGGGGGAESAALDGAAAKIVKKFKCATCHAIDGDEDGGDSGPALWRAGYAEEKLPPFGELYTREYFRRKVGDPEGFWIDTGMNYPKRAGKTMPQDKLDTLEAWFFDAK